VRRSYRGVAALVAIGVLVLLIAASTVGRLVVMGA